MCCHNLYLSLNCLQLFLQVASRLFILLLLLQQGALFLLQLADSAAQVQLLTRLLLQQLLHTRIPRDIREMGRCSYAWCDHKPDHILNYKKLS